MADQITPDQISLDADQVVQRFESEVAALTRRAVFAETRLDITVRTLNAERDRFEKERQAMLEADADAALRADAEGERDDVDRVP